MAQYKSYADNTYDTFLDNSTGLQFRLGQRNHFYVEDKELTALGFAGVENTDWTNIGGYGNPGDEVTGSFCRIGVRGGNWVVDIELTATGFDGVEDTDWKYVGGVDKI
jgi:hypothetical protein